MQGWKRIGLLKGTGEKRERKALSGGYATMPGGQRRETKKETNGKETKEKGYWARRGLAIVKAKKKKKT